MGTILSYPAGLSPAQEAAAAPPEGRWLNALTVDVEDYYHVSGFEGVIDRGRWDDLESRVGVSTDRLLDCLAAANVRATFFVLGWVAGRGGSGAWWGRSAGGGRRSAATATSTG